MRVAGFFVIFVAVIVIGLPVAGAEGRAGLAEQNERRRVIAPPGPKPVGPYSPGILAGDFLYVSGQGGRDAEPRTASYCSCSKKPTRTLAKWPL